MPTVEESEVSESQPTADQSASTSGSGSNRALPWQIATIVLAIATIGFAIWGFNTSSQLSEEQASAQQQIAELQQQLTAAEKTASVKEAAEEKIIESLRSKADEYKSKLKVDTSDLKSDATEIRKLEQEYDDAQAEAKKKENNLEAQLKASQAEAALAKKCANLMANGLMKIYESKPTSAIFKEIDQLLSDASAACGKVIDVNDS